tara:strand:+ start:89 stop:1396 length:1308 start_codon:yes stop_codon:yes gene_type:complete
MTSITFLNHASFILKSKNLQILNDPYLFGSAFNSGWSLLTEADYEIYLNKITHIYYSHEHPDHFSVPFLKRIDEKKRKNITIIYQETFDKRVKNFCENLGYKFKELKNHVEEKFDENLFITLGKVPFYDSWINYRIDNKNILNVNDCALEDPSILNKVKKRIKNIHTLFTQFSYATHIPIEDQKKEALKCLDSIKLQDDILKPKNIIPFASFIYFSHEQNKFMNKNINTICDVNNFISKNCLAKSIILKPNETWNLIEKNNDESLKFWEKIYENIENLNYQSNINTFESEELILKSKKYIKRINDRNNQFLIKLLIKIKFFIKINIFVHDLNKFFEFDLINGLIEVDKKFNETDCIQLDSESLSFVFDYDYGLDTLLVSARFKVANEYKQKIIRCFLIGSINNTGRFIKFKNFYKYLNFDFIKKSLQLIELKKKY